MKIVNIAVVTGLAMHASFVHADASEACVSAYETAQQDKIIATAQQNNRVVSGPGRLYFHTAPDARCRQKDLFVVPNDRLEVFSDHAGFTEVIYWHPVTGTGTAGWVASARLAEIRELVGLASSKRDTVSR
jgi:hypothetical protein